MGGKWIFAVDARPAELTADKIHMSLRYRYPRKLKDLASVPIGRDTACRLDKYKILCMPSKYTLSWSTCQ